MRLALTQPLRFIIAGGLAAAINWLARIALSFLLPLEASVLIAYAIGMVAGFVLYRAFVFAGASGPMAGQIARFIAVNAVGAVVVLLVTLGGKLALTLLLPGHSPALLEAFAHALAIAAGAFANYAGHKQVTFPEAAQSR